MGFRVSWLAHAAISPNLLLQLIDSEPKGERHDFPDVGWYLLEMPDPAWTILIADGTDNFAKLNERIAQGFSCGGNETLFFWCSDTTMTSQLMCFRNGTKAWSIDFDCEDTTQALRLSGDLPDVVRETLSEMKGLESDEEDGAEGYDLPADVGRKLTGFRHDMDVDHDEDEPFQLLSEPRHFNKSKRAWWQFWK